jgi:hypothetical protein
VTGAGGEADLRAAALANYEAQRDAMVAGDADRLDGLLGQGFTLTHMTGYVQTRPEWVADVRSGEMTYHAIDDVDVSVDIEDGTPVVTARSRTTATIWGSRGTWPLQLEIYFASADDGWLALRTVASTWG